MAEIRPLQAWRYNKDLSRNIETLTSPLFDVVSERQRRALYQNPYSSVHLSVPQGSHPDQEAAARLSQWKREGIVTMDPIPGIYVYYQRFSLHGSDRLYTRKGFICNIRIYDWPEKVILRHENTMPHSVNDRQMMVEATQLNVSPTHGLYTDPTKEIESYLDECMVNPLYEVEDYQGVIDSLGVIHDRKVVERIIEIIKEKQIILADGHHRYGGSLEHYKKMKAQNPNHTGQEGYNFHLMYMTNTESDDLRILPTHRIISNDVAIDEEELLRKLAPDFIIKPLDNPEDIGEIILGKKWAFGLLIGDNAYKIRLKPEMIDTLPWKFPPEINRLDLTVMHYFIFEKILGIPGRKQREAKEISFERNFTECVKKVYKREAAFAVITQDISVDTVKEVCYSGYTLPQKSTYFYPKVICGFLFSSIQDDEFHTPLSSSFQFPQEESATH